ncbi:MAG: N-6 DNA methylase [Promethearchaeota archaeon]
MEKNNIRQLLLKLNITPGSQIQFEILVTCLKKIITLLGKENIADLKNDKLQILQPFNKLSEADFRLIERNLMKSNLTIEECQIMVQKNIPQKERKILAAYFTNNDGLFLMQSLIAEYDKKYNKKAYKICDPFIGSGRTLTAAIEKIGANKFDFIWGVEAYYLSALVAYTSLLNSVNGDSTKIDVLYGDAFKYLPDFIHWNNKKYLDVDFILTNPPFTRWKNISDKMKKRLPNIINELGFCSYLTRNDAGLQIYSMFLCEKIIKNLGLIVAVLPSSTFYTIGSRGYKRLIKDKNNILALIEATNESAFSIDSGFKEIILVSQRIDRENKTLFAKLNAKTNELANAIINQIKYEKGKYYDLKTLPNFLDNNWLALFPENDGMQERIIDIIIDGYKTNLFANWTKVLGKDKIVRGFEMYGPDFFFIPNKYWIIIDESDLKIKIQNIKTKKTLAIEKDYLVKALRKPSYYRNRIEVKLDSYVLALPEFDLSDFPQDLRDYIKWGIKSSIPKLAIRKFGKYWYSHIFKTIKNKQPFGHIFISDKIDLKFKKRGVLANYSTDLVTASKNFYVIKNIEPEISEVFCAWLNSSYFIIFFILFGRKISNTWSRLLIDDYLKLPMLNLGAIKKEFFMKIQNVFQKIKDEDLPSFYNQLNSHLRFELDCILTKALGIENAEEFVINLHKSLRNFFSNKQ